MQTLRKKKRHGNNRLAFFTERPKLSLLCLAIGFIACAEATSELLQLDCIQRDWNTVFARQDVDITGLELAVTEAADMTRLLVAVSEETKQGLKSSFLAYLDYLTCEQLFFIRNDFAYSAGLFSLAIYSADMSSTKPFETIYQVGKAQESNQVIATIVEQDTVRTISFSFSDDLGYPNDSTEDLFNSNCALSVIEANLLLWKHPLGMVVLDLNLMVARSINFSPSLALTSLEAVPMLSRYIFALSWDWSPAESDVLWMNAYDFSSFSGSVSSPVQSQSNRFVLGSKVDGFIVSDAFEDAVALCYSDSQRNLNLALWRADESDAGNMYTLTLEESFSTIVNGCTSVELKQIEDTMKLTAIVYFTKDRLSLLSLQYRQSSLQTLESSESRRMVFSSKLSSQKFFMFIQPTNLQYRAVPGFFALRARMFGEKDKWAFILNTDLSQVRKTQLWLPGNYQSATLTKLTALTDSSLDSHSVAISRAQSGQTSEQKLTQWAFQFNAWVSRLCEQPEKVTLQSDNEYLLDYPTRQEFKLHFHQIIETQYDRGNSSWFRTCFPNVSLEVPTGSKLQFDIVDFDENSALVSVENVPSAKIYVSRQTLLGQNNLRFFERVVYDLQLPASIGTKYFVAYENRPPQIVDPAPINDQIFISVQWAPNPLLNETALMEDVNGKNWDILYESGKIVDTEGDTPTLELLNLTRVFHFEITVDGRVRISMKQRMEKQFTGLHSLYFSLTGNEKVEGPPMVYHAVIAIGLYKADPVAHAKRVKDKEAKIIDKGFQENTLESLNTVPSPPEIASTEDWWHRRPYSERKAQLRVASVTCDGHLKISFTKPVDLPVDIIDVVERQKLVNVTFWPSTYDVEEDTGVSTEIKQWQIVEVSEHGMLLEVEFLNPNLLGYSIYEADLLKLDVDLKSIKQDGSTDELFGNYIKSVPLQYPQQFTAAKIYELNQAIEMAPYAFFMSIFLSFALLAVSAPSNKTAVVWIIVTNMHILVLLPLVNVPVPAQVNEIGKGLSKYLRVDFIELDHLGQSLTASVAQYIFDFPAESHQIPLHLEQMGFDSRNSLQTSSGVNLLHCAIVVPILLLLAVFGLFKCATKKRCSLTVFQKLRSVFNNNFYVRYNMETFVVYSICYFMSITETKFSNWMTAFQSTLSALHLLLLAFLPIIVIFFYNWNYERLVSNKHFRATWGSLYLGLVGEEEKTKRTIAYKYPALQLSRKLVFAFFVVVLDEYWVLQLGFIFLSSTLMIYVVSLYSPYQSRILNRLQVMFDCTVVILTDFMIAFNGGGWLSTDQNVRFEIGWGYTGCLLLCLSVAFLTLGRVTLSAVRRTLMVQVVKKSKQKLKMERRKSRMNRRQSVKMERLMQMSASNIIPVMSVEELSKEQSNTNSSSLNSPNMSSGRVIQQQNDNLLQVKIDNDNFRRGLTQIEESDHEEEDESSNLSGTESNLSQTDQDDYFFQQPNNFVMGFEFLPKIHRQRIVIGRNKKRSRSGPRLSSDLNTLPIIKGFIESENRKKNKHTKTDPSLFSPGNKLKNLNQSQQSHSANNSSDGEESFKASSRIKQSKSHQKHRRNRSGYKTTKFEESGASFSKHLQYKVNRAESTSQLDNQSAQCTDRVHMLSQQDTKRGGTMAQRSQISNRSRQYQYQTHQAMSRRSRSSSIMLDELDDAVSQKLEMLAERKADNFIRKSASEAVVSEDQQALCSKQTTPSKRKSVYVMGEQMARDSMIHDMASNAVIMSKVHESTTELVTQKQGRLSRVSSIEISYTYEKEFDPRKMRKKLSKDSRGTLNRLSLQGSPNRNRSSPLDQPEVNKLLSGLQQQSSSPIESINSENKGNHDYSRIYMKDAEPAQKPQQNQLVAQVKQRIPSPKHVKNYVEQKCDEDSPRSPPLRKPRAADQRHFAKGHLPSAPSIQNLILEEQPGEQRMKLTPMNIPLNVHHQREVSHQIIEESSQIHSSRSNQSLQLIVEKENLKFEKEENLRVSMQLAKQGSSPGIQSTPQFQTDALNSPDFSMGIRPIEKSALNSPARDKSKLVQDEHVPNSPPSKLIEQRNSNASAKQPSNKIGSLDQLEGNGQDGEVDGERRYSSQSKQSRPADMPMLNLNADSLLKGINVKVEKRMAPLRNMSVASIQSDLSKVSKFSKFTIEDNDSNNPDTASIDVDDEDMRSLPTNVKFASMK